MPSVDSLDRLGRQRKGNEMPRIRDWQGLVSRDDYFVTEKVRQTPAPFKAHKDMCRCHDCK